MDEADVAVRHHRLDLEMAIIGHDHEQRLRRRHHASDGVHRKLLHDAVDRRRKQLKFGPLLSLDQIFARLADFLFGLRQIARKGASILGRGLGAGFRDRCDRRLGLLVAALLDEKILLLVDELLEVFPDR